MKGPITWRNVTSANFGDVATMAENAGDRIMGAFDPLATALEAEQATRGANWQQGKTNNTEALMSRIQGLSTQEDLTAAIQSSALDPSQYGAQVDAAKIRAAIANRDDQIFADQKAGIERTDFTRTQAERVPTANIETLIAAKNFDGAQSALDAAAIQDKSGLTQSIAAGRQRLKDQLFADEQRSRTRAEWARTDTDRTQQEAGSQGLNDIFAKDRATQAHNDEIRTKVAAAYGGTIINGEIVLPDGPDKEANMEAVQQALYNGGLERRQTLGEMENSIRSLASSQKMDSTETQTLVDSLHKQFNGMGKLSDKARGALEGSIGQLDLEKQHQAKVIEEEYQHVVAQNPFDKLSTPKEIAKDQETLMNYIGKVSPDDKAMFGIGGDVLKKRIEGLIQTGIPTATGTNAKVEPWMVQTAVATLIDNEDGWFADNGIDSFSELEDIVARLANDPSSKLNMETVRNARLKRDKDLLDLDTKHLRKISKMTSQTYRENGVRNRSASNNIINRIEKLSVK